MTRNPKPSNTLSELADIDPESLSPEEAQEVIEEFREVFSDFADAVKDIFNEIRTAFKGIFQGIADVLAPMLRDWAVHRTGSFVITCPVSGYGIANEQTPPDKISEPPGGGFLAYYDCPSNSCPADSHTHIWGGEVVDPDDVR